MCATVKYIFNNCFFLHIAPPKRGVLCKTDDLYRSACDCSFKMQFRYASQSIDQSIVRSSASLNNTEIVKPFVLCVKSAHTWVNLWEIGVQRPIEWMKARFTAFRRFRTILCRRRRRRYFIMFVWELRCATWPSDNCNMDRHNTRAGA